MAAIAQESVAIVEAGAFVAYAAAGISAFAVSVDRLARQLPFAAEVAVADY